MKTRATTTATILIATDNVTDAAIVKNLLSPEFDHIVISIDPEKVLEDFVRHLPSVLVLAFNTLKKSERYYLEWYRLSEVLHQIPYRTVVLCNRNEVKQVYELCTPLAGQNPPVMATSKSPTLMTV